MMLKPLVLRSFVRRSLGCRFSSIDAVESLPSSSENVCDTSKEAKEIKKLVIPGLTDFKTKQTEVYYQKFSEVHEQKIEHDDWSIVWPCENFFSPYMFPAPIRQGLSKNLVENGGLPPAKYANAELLKIRNFLHLTPSHVEKHCQALKKFLTKWPSGLKTDADINRHYPVEVITQSFTNSSPSIRDTRARRVTIRVQLKSLGLDERAKLKLLRLAKVYGFERGMAQYYSDEDVLELSSDRCPISTQNYDYLNYVLSVLTMESKKHEAWEDEETGSYLDFKWERSQQRKRVLDLFSGETDPSRVEKLPAVKAYRAAVEAMFKTPTEENTGPWKKPKKQPKIRHYHWPEIKDVAFEPVVGADVAENLDAYAEAVKKLYTEGKSSA
nr:mitochondrial ribosomal protein s35 [Hymenolepis microstoma]